MDKLLLRRILVAVLSFLAVIYAVYLLVSANFNMLPTENAVEVTVTDTVYSDGYIIRDETYVKNNTSGILSYSLNDGDAVRVGGEIAKVFSNEDDAAAQTKADELEKKLNSLHSLQSSFAKNTTDIDTINNDINTNILSMLNNMNNGEVGNVNNYINNLVSSINQRQVYTGKVTDFNTAIAQLQTQINDLRGSSGSSIGTILSEKAGYFSAHCDGYENSIKSIDVDKIKIDDLDNVSRKSVEKNVAGKIVSSMGWYVACVVSADDATRLSLWDGAATVKLLNVYSESIPASIERIYQENDNSDAVVILKCNYMNSNLIDARKEPVEIGLGNYKGLRISKKAIHDDYVTKVTYDENDNMHTETSKVQGVYVLYGSEVQFKQIVILYANQDYVICDKAPDSKLLFNGETVSLYDQVIIEGDDLYDGKVIQ
ncbi:MAG: hypothetical protein MJ089_06175 [Ruminococcus sp.]|nr:hypothetical protein [Ruminococcus sp.]